LLNSLADLLYSEISIQVFLSKLEELDPIWYHLIQGVVVRMLLVSKLKGLPKNKRGSTL
jgi:hypothetical protein